MTAATPSSSSKSSADLPKRSFCSHTPKWQRFQATLIVPSEKAAGLSTQAKEVYVYQRQYSHVYDQRLAMLKPRCWEALKDETATRVNRILELANLPDDTRSMVVGTVVKEAGDPKQDVIHPDTKCRASDQVYLEDDSGRVALDVEFPYQYCTGIVLGAVGIVDHTGTLKVDRIACPHSAAPPALTESSPEEATDEDSCVLLISNMQCGGSNVSSLQREMVLSYINGHFTSDAKKVARVIVAGGGPSSKNPLEGSKEFDKWTNHLLKSGVPVDVLPGSNDPTTASWPQRPLHSSLFPKSSKSNIFSRSPNPYAAQHGARLVMGTDGENIADLRKSILQQQDDDAGASTLVSDLHALNKTLDWAHMCPTGPDSVPTIPHADMDPMVLSQTPHVYFSGSATKFDSALVNDQTRLVCVPSFAETGEVVLVNLKSLDVELLRFRD
jgi:DNA polymerase delta subunit 2